MDYYVEINLKTIFHFISFMASFLHKTGHVLLDAIIEYEFKNR